MWLIILCLLVELLCKITIKKYSKKCLLLQDVCDVLYAVCVCVFCMLCVFCCFVWRVLRNGAMVSKTVSKMYFVICQASAGTLQQMLLFFKFNTGKPAA